MRIGLLLFLATAITACDPYGSIQMSEDIEAFEQYLKEYPSSPNVVPARARLEDLYLKQAREAKTLEADDTYLERWPKGVFKKKAMEERKTMLLAWAEQEHTPESWQKFLDEYPLADRRMRGKARRGKAAAEYMPHLNIGEVTVQQVNLAENPEGPLDGWGLTADITNNGPDALKSLIIHVSFLNKDGVTLSSDTWPLVASQFPIPMEEEKKVPVKTGETRTWEWTTGSVPEGWSQKVSIKPVAIAFVDKELRSKGSE